MSTLWLLELSPRHVSRAAQLSSSACRVPWSSRSLVAAMTAEFLGTLALSVIPRLYISSNPTLANNDPGMKVTSSICICLCIYFSYVNDGVCTQ